VKSGYKENCRFGIAILTNCEVIVSVILELRDGSRCITAIPLTEGLNCLVICRANWRSLVGIEVIFEKAGGTMGSWSPQAASLSNYKCPPKVLVLSKNGVPPLSSLCRLKLGQHVMEKIPSVLGIRLPDTLTKMTYFFLRGAYYHPLLQIPI
jgi:hypothetical protein